MLQPNAAHGNLHVMQFTKCAPKNPGNDTKNDPIIPLLPKDQISILRLIL